MMNQILFPPAPLHTPPVTSGLLGIVGAFL